MTGDPYGIIVLVSGVVKMGRSYLDDQPCLLSTTATNG